MKILYDCKYYKGDKPCVYQKLCSDCDRYQPMGKRIVVIKLGSIGDALRTTTVLPALKNKYKNCHITWITNKDSYQLLKFSHLIDRLIILDFQNSLKFIAEEFDLLLSFDKAPEAINLAVLCKAKEKKGFCVTKKGILSVFNKGSEYALMLGLSNDLKFRANRKTYQEIIFEMADLAYHRQEYVLDVPYNDSFKRKFLIKYKIEKDEIIIGIFSGCGRIFPTKKWSIQGFAELINMLGKENKFRVVLLGGPEEINRNREIKSLINTEIIDTGCNNTLEEFINIIRLLDLVVTGDTLALHLAIANKKRVIGIFTSTCPQEIELYGRGQIVKSDIECSPCYKKICDVLICLEAIKAKVVFEAVKRQLEKLGKVQTTYAAYKCE